MTDRLEQEALAFADRLSGLFEAALGIADSFWVAIDTDGRRARIGPRSDLGPGDGLLGSIPLRRACDPVGGEPPMGLRVEYKVELEERDERHLTVLTSVFGLWVKAHESGKPKPVFRVEYDRHTTGSKPSAHVHLHAESVELGWVYGTAGLPMPRLQEIHFPVGGRRFRPTIEEVLLFLDRERLFTAWRDGWRPSVDASIHEWERRQARATVREHLDIAIEFLQERGYTIRAPHNA